MEWRVVVWLLIIGLVVGWLFSVFVQSEKVSPNTNLVSAALSSVVGGGIFYFLGLGGELILGGTTALLVLFVIFVFKMGD